jgi:hypothetical protein
MDVIFETKERTRTAPKKPGEGDYAFYDSSARPQFETYRNLLNEWLIELPEVDRPEMIKRFRKGTDLQHQAALAELTLHAALKREGSTIVLHPTCEHPT